MFKTSRRTVVSVIPLLVLGICFGFRISNFGFESPAHGCAVQIRPGGAPGQRAGNSRNTQNPACAPEAGWPPAAVRGQNASPGRLRPSNPSLKSSEEPGFVPSSGEPLPRIRFTTETHCQPKVPGKNDNLADWPHYGHGPFCLLPSAFA